MSSPPDTTIYGEKRSRELLSSAENSAQSTPVAKRLNMGLTQKDLEDLRGNIKSDTEKLFEPVSKRLENVERVLNNHEQIIRANNIVIHGLQEIPHEKQYNLVQLVSSFLDNIGQPNILINNVNRIGKPSSGVNRPILLKPVRGIDKIPIFMAAKDNKTHNQKVYLNDDLTKEQQSQQKLLRAHLQTMKTADAAVRGSIRGNSLFIRKDDTVTHRLQVRQGKIVNL